MRFGVFQEVRAGERRVALTPSGVGALITLGREAFLWFGIGQSKAERARIEAFWQRPDRFESAIAVTLAAPEGPARTFDIHPLPHPSPLNATWYKRFPGLLAQRLEQLDVRIDNLEC